MSLLYDSTNPRDIPAGVQRAGYCDGIYRWSAADLVGAVRIAVSAATNDGDALDVENGDATPDQAPGWVSRRRAAGVPRPWVYCNRSNRSAVEFNLKRFGITADQVALWVATLDGTQVVAAGPFPVAAVQYANATLAGGHYDISLVNDLFGPGGGSLEDDMFNDLDRKYLYELGQRVASLTGVAGTDTVTVAPTLSDLATAIKAIPAGGGAVDLAPVLAAIADLKAHPAVVADPAVLDIVTRIETGLKAA